MWCYILRTCRLSYVVGAYTHLIACLGKWVKFAGFIISEVIHKTIEVNVKKHHDRFLGFLSPLVK